MEKRFDAEKKVQILKEHLTEGVQVSELAKKYDLHPNQFYKWRKDLFEGALNTFSGKHKNPRKSSRTDKLEEELTKKDKIISFLAEENLKLKKKYFGTD